jgi:hypothetical protein
MNERIELCLEWQRRWNEAECGRVDVAELCRVFRIRRPRGYVWLRRFERPASARADRGPVETSHTSLTAIAEPMQEMVVWARMRHPRWGPRKLRAWLVRLHPAQELPSAMTRAASPTEPVARAYRHTGPRWAKTRGLRAPGPSSGKT